VSSQPKNGLLSEEVVFSDRGNYTKIERKLFLEDAFGLARIALRHNDELKIRVLPHCGGLRQLPVLVSLATGDGWPHPMGLEDGDRVDLRRYAPGDPARFIHWKVFGRTRKLMVRVPERAVSPARRTAAYVVAGEGDDASCAAARVAVETASLGEQWTFSADGANEDVGTSEQAVQLIVRSIEARGDGANGLGSFLTRVQRKGPAKVIVFAPPRGGIWMDRVISASKRTVGHIKVVIGVDGITEATPRSRIATWIWRRPEQQGTELNELEDVLRRLGTQCDLVVVDRKTGKFLGEGHRWALRQKRDSQTNETNVPTKRNTKSNDGDSRLSA
jgi:hypothetical protein